MTWRFGALHVAGKFDVRILHRQATNHRYDLGYDGIYCTLTEESIKPHWTQITHYPSPFQP